MRMQYVEFTHRQDVETLLNCTVHAFRYFGGVTATVLTDNMKTVVLDRIDGHGRMACCTRRSGSFPSR
ncbi:MAG: hypothetical protein ABI076_07110 [Acidobacteriaceae bacterium]